MPIQHVPLLQIERNLHDIPRGMERFGAYLKTMINDARDDVRYPPLVAMNPMGREHVAERLDELLRLNAESIAVDAIADTLDELGELPYAFEHGWVVMDDVRGGWTNRTSGDMGARFGFELPFKRPWLTTAWWVSESPTSQRLRSAVRATVARIHYVHTHGAAKTLRQMMTQEGSVAAFAGQTPAFDDEELEYSRFVIAPYLDTDNYAVCIAALFGDTAAHALGYAPLGLSTNAGFEVALADALAKTT